MSFVQRPAVSIQISPRLQQCLHRNHAQSVGEQVAPVDVVKVGSRQTMELLMSEVHLIGVAAQGEPANVVAANLVKRLDRLRLQVHNRQLSTERIGNEQPLIVIEQQ